MQFEKNIGSASVTKMSEQFPQHIFQLILVNDVNKRRIKIM